jgi:hypothetical protein
MVVCTVVLFACVGLTIDVGYLQMVKSRMQTAADAAAVGATQERRQNGSAHVVDAAKSDAALNGFTDGQNSVVVTVNSPPASGYYTADTSSVEVLISQNVGALFMSALGFSSVKVSARSVARLGSGSNRIYALDPAASGAFTIAGGATLTVSCGIMVASSHASAMIANGGAHLTAASINVAGGYQPGGGVVVTPTPTTHVTPESDPLAYLVPPAVGGCTQTGWSASNASTKAIVPGVFCGGITINGGSTVTMSPGTYILLGGGLNVSNGAKLSGSGVTFFVTSNGTYPYGPVNLAGGTTIQLSAPTTGTYAGILFYQDPSIASPAASSFSNGTTVTFDGALYFPTSALAYSGGASANYTILVAKTVSFSNGTTVNSNYAVLPGGSPVKGNASLSE